MKTRPWPLVILAILQFLSPVATILFNAYVLDVKASYVVKWMLEKPPIQIFETLLLMPIAGIAIYQMKRWGYFVFFAAMIWGLGSNLMAIRQSPDGAAPGVMALLFAAPMALALYFLLPSVRRTYMDPTVRWWEAKRRFLLDVPLDIQAAGPALTCKAQNISEGGVAFLISDAEAQKIGLKNEQEIRIRFSVANVEFSVPGMVMYSMQQPGGRFYGVRFLHTSETRKRFVDLMKGLELIGVAHRDQDVIKPWYINMRDWAFTLAKTGKGLVPEVKSTRKT